MITLLIVLFCEISNGNLEKPSILYILKNWFELHHYLLLITFKVKANKEKYFDWTIFFLHSWLIILFFTFIISGLFDYNFVAKMIINETSKIGTIIEDFRHFEIENDSGSETWLRDKKGRAKVSFVFRLKTRLDIRCVFEKLWSKK